MFQKHFLNFKLFFVCLFYFKSLFYPLVNVPIKSQYNLNLNLNPEYKTLEKNVDYMHIEKRRLHAHMKNVGYMHIRKVPHEIKRK